MYTKGNIIYFSPFYFTDGGKSKNKYFIVLNSNENNALVASLPTSKDHIPSFIEKKHGCIEVANINFNCYYFEPNLPITDENWGFPEETFVYGPQISKFDRGVFEEIYAFEGVDYEIVGKLKEDEFNAIRECIINSKSVKRKIKRLL